MVIWQEGCIISKVGGCVWGIVILAKVARALGYYEVLFSRTDEWTLRNEKVIIFLKKFSFVFWLMNVHLVIYFNFANVSNKNVHGNT